MEKLFYALIGISVILLTGCSSVIENIIDGRHRHTNIYLPGKVGELQLGKEKVFDKEGKDIGYFYKNFDHDNFVTLVVYIYPIPDRFAGNEAIERELAYRYPNQPRFKHVLTQGKFTAEGMYIRTGNERLFANEPNQSVVDLIYVFTFGDNWFVKYAASYQQKNEETAKPVVDAFLDSFHWIEPSDFQGYDL